MPLTPGNEGHDFLTDVEDLRKGEEEHAICALAYPARPAFQVLPGLQQAEVEQ